MFFFFIPLDANGFSIGNKHAILPHKVSNSHAQCFVFLKMFSFFVLLRNCQSVLTYLKDVHTK